MNPTDQIQIRRNSSLHTTVVGVITAGQQQCSCLKSAQQLSPDRKSCAITFLSILRPLGGCLALTYLAKVARKDGKILSAIGGAVREVVKNKVTDPAQWTAHSH